MPEALARAELSLEEREEVINRVFVPIPRYESILREIRRTHMESPKLNEPRNLVIVGKSGVGKSTLRKRYEGMFPRFRDTEGVLHVPVLAYPIREQATVKSMVRGMLRTLGEPASFESDRIPEHVLTQVLLDRINLCGVELTIVDEFQEFVEQNSASLLVAVSNWLKNLSEESRKPIIMLGTPKCLQVLKADEEGQLRRRFENIRSLDTFRWDLVSTRTEFINLLRYVEHCFPFPRESQLHIPLTARRIHYASEGVLAGVMNLLKEAGIRALRDGDDHISMEILREVFEDKRQSKMMLGEFCENPFSLPETEVEKLPFHPDAERRSKAKKSGRGAQALARDALRR